MPRWERAGPRRGARGAVIAKYLQGGVCRAQPISSSTADSNVLSSRTHYSFAPVPTHASTHVDRATDATVGPIARGWTAACRSYSENNDGYEIGIMLRERAWRSRADLPVVMRARGRTRLAKLKLLFKSSSSSRKKARRGLSARARARGCTAEPFC